MKAIKPSTKIIYRTLNNTANKMGLCRSVMYKWQHRQRLCNTCLHFPKTDWSFGSQHLMTVIWESYRLESIETMEYDTVWNKKYSINTLRPRQNDRLFAGDTFKHIFLNENNKISIKISLKFVPKGPINNIPAMVQIMAWRRPGDKPLSEPMVVSLLTHICVARPQWVKSAHGCVMFCIVWLCYQFL